MITVKTSLKKFLMMVRTFSKCFAVIKEGNYLVIKAKEVMIVKEVMDCGVSHVVMFQSDSMHKKTCQRPLYSQFEY